MSELTAGRIEAPTYALACLIQGIRDGSDERNAERIAKLDGHRNQWRRIAFRLEEELRKHDKEAGDAIFENWDRIDLRDPEAVHSRLVQIEEAVRKP